MGTGVSRRVLLARVCLAVVAAGAMLAGSFALVGTVSQFAVGEGDSPTTEATAAVTSPAPSSRVRGNLISRIEDTPDLDAGAIVIGIPLAVDPKSAGRMYIGSKGTSVQLGPPDLLGMTQDGLDSESPPAILLPDGEHLLYHFWHHLTDFPTYAPGDPVVKDGTHMATPSIRMHDLVSGEDTLVISGARSMAWRSDGMFAYAKGIDDDYRLNVPYLERVVVQQGIDGVPEVWTPDAGVYTVYRWVDEALFVWEQSPFQGRTLLAIEGPGKITRPLSDGDWFLGVSPDGTRILAASGGLFSEGPLVIREIEWRSGKVVASVSFEGVLDPLSNQAIVAATGASWEGDGIAVALNPAGFALLSAEEGLLTLEDVISLNYPKMRLGSVQELLLDQARSKVVIVSEEINENGRLERSVVLTYDLSSGKCTRWVVPGPPADARLVLDSRRLR